MWMFLWIKIPASFSDLLNRQYNLKSSRKNKDIECVDNKFEEVFGK